MRRREFIAGLGGAAVWPVVAWGQQPMPVVAILGSATQAATADVVPLFILALGEQGFREGRNIRFEYRSADGHYDRLPALAADLVGRNVAIIFAMGNSPWAARDVTKTIPIVFANGSDPVEAGLVASLNHPGGNVTGATWTSNPMVPKRMEMLRDLVPKIEVIGALVNPRNPSAAIDIRALQAAAGSLGLQFALFKASVLEELNAAFAAMAAPKVDAIVLGADSFFTSHSREIVALTTRYRLPSTHVGKGNVVAGGLLSYSARRDDAFRVAGTYAGRIIRGEKPGNLPVQLPTRFELVINLKTAKALGLTVPPSLLAITDEVIE